MDQQFQELGLKEDDFYSVTWDMVNFQGHIWGLVQEFDMVEFFTNRNIFTGEPPKTVDELDAVASDYIKMEGDNWSRPDHPLGAGWLQPGRLRLLGHDLGRSLLRHRRAQVDDQPAGEHLLARLVPEVRRHHRRSREGRRPHLLGAEDLRHPLPLRQDAFSMEGEFIPLELPAIGQGELVDKIDITHPPIVPGVTSATCMVDAANVYCIPVNSKHVAEAAFFAKYMVSPIRWSPGACRSGKCCRPKPPPTTRRCSSSSPG